MKRSILTIGLAFAAGLIYFAAPPQGISPAMMHAGALVVFTVGLWAIGALPEHLVALIFFALAMVLQIAPPQAVFAGFASGTPWLVLGGLIMAEAAHRTGLAQRVAGVLFDRFAGSYTHLVVLVVVAAGVLSFFVPATVSRVLLLLPIVMALAQRVGLDAGSRGYDGLCIAAITATYQSGTGVLPANVPNLVFAGSAEALYGVSIQYAEYLRVQFPVMGVMKCIVIIVLVLWLFPARTSLDARAGPAPPLNAAQKRLALIVAAALVLWTTDLQHGIKAGWVALGAGILCLMPRVGVLPPAAFAEVRVGPFFYVAATIGVGVVIQQSGMSEGLGTLLLGVLPLGPGADFANFMILSVLTTLAGLFTTNPAQPAVLTPLAGHFAQATGWPIMPALMVVAAGYATFLLPYQIPPAMVGMQVGRLRMGAMLRLVLPLAVIGITVMLPLQYLWWLLIGYFDR